MFYTFVVLARVYKAFKNLMFDLYYEKMLNSYGMKNFYKFLNI